MRGLTDRDAGPFEVRVRASHQNLDVLVANVLAEVPRRSSVRFIVRDAASGMPRLRVYVGHPDEAHDVARECSRFGQQDGLGLEISVPSDASFAESVAPYRGTDAAPMLAASLSQAFVIVVDLLRDCVRTRADRRGFALDLMVAHLPAIDLLAMFPGRYPSTEQTSTAPAAFPVYRSHADGFFLMATDPAAARIRFDDAYDASAEAIQGRVFAGLQRYTEPGSLHERWYRIGSAFVHNAAIGFERKTLSIDVGEGSMWDDRDVSASAFHTEVQQQRELREFLFADSGYRAVRFSIAALYMTLAALGIGLGERAFFCHAIARTCEESFGIDPASSLRRAAERIHCWTRPENHAIA